ncbi:MAG: hypothetical protein ACLUR5_15920 [Eubacterium ventriosum]
MGGAGWSLHISEMSWGQS